MAKRKFSLTEIFKSKNIESSVDEDINRESSLTVNKICRGL
jgi:hypothetical protein